MSPERSGRDVGGLRRTMPPERVPNPAGPAEKLRDRRGLDTDSAATARLENSAMLSVSRLLNGQVGPQDGGALDPACHLTDEEIAA